MNRKRLWKLSSAAALLAASGTVVGGALQYGDRQRQTRLLQAELNAQPPHADVLRRLLDRGADPLAEGSGGKNLLMIAARLDAPDLVTRALQAGIDVTRRDQFGDGALEYAINESRGRPEPVTVVRTLVDHGVGLDGVTMSSGGPLFTAASLGEAEVVRILVTGGAHINQQETNGYTPLFHAALGRQPQAVEMLLSLGADPFIRDQAGRTAAEEARLDGAKRHQALRQGKAHSQELAQTERDCKAVLDMLR